MPNPKSSQISHNLPTLLSTFIGREREIAELRQLLLSNRLITLTGAGGAGKTRLALKVAQEVVGDFMDGVWLVELASITDSLLVPQMIASPLNIREESGHSLIDVLVEKLSTRESLLVLDNCEHLISSCAQLAEILLQQSPALKILATSREALGITGEVAWKVPPLSLPAEQPWTNPASAQDAVRFYKESESVQLFAIRAAAYNADFTLSAENGVWVAEICRRLDGMPLAIELAAARARALSVQEIAARLDDRFHLLTIGSRTAPPRQQTLAAALDWSYALLSDQEQKVLQRLSVFAGGATLEAAEAVCAGDGIEPAKVLNALSNLVDKSLVLANRPGRGETRYHLLETIRQYALEKLAESSEMEEFKNQHLNHFIRWTENAEPHLTGAEQLKWLELYEADHDNLRAALEWCATDESKADLGLQLALACGRFWRLRGYLSEGRAQLSAALSRVDVNQKTETRAQALLWEASLAYLQSDYPATRRLGEESLSLWRELNPSNKVGLAETLDILGELATEEGDYATAPALFEEALEIFRQLENTRGIGDMLLQIGWAYMRNGEYDRVAVYMEEGLSLFRRLGHMSLLGFTLAGLGELAIRQNQNERALQFLEESLTIRRQHGHKWGIGASLGSLGWVALLQRDFKQMRKRLDESLAIRLEIGDKGGIAWCLEKLAEAAKLEGEHQKSVRVFGAASALRAPLGSVIDPADQADYGRIIAELQSTLGMATFAALWSEGAAMPIIEIIDFALSEPKFKTESTRAQREKYGGLTVREREVVVLIAQGKSNREIAAAMTVGVKTVETYVTRILNKLGYDTRVQIATWAVEKGLRSVVE